MTSNIWESSTQYETALNMQPVLDWTILNVKTVLDKWKPYSMWKQCWTSGNHTQCESWVLDNWKPYSMWKLSAGQLETIIKVKAELVWEKIFYLWEKCQRNIIAEANKVFMHQHIHGGIRHVLLLQALQVQTSKMIILVAHTSCWLIVKKNFVKKSMVATWCPSGATM